MSNSAKLQATRNRNGFTLIELLVVIAIIAILAAILFPVFAQAREKARAISCLSNLNQLGKGIIMYVQDYDETLPYWNFSLSADGFGGNQNGVFTSWWFNATYPYYKSVAVLKCPDDNVTGMTPAAFWPGVWTNKPIDKVGIDPALYNAQISYGMTETMMCGEANGNWGSASSAVTLASLNKPSETMVLADAAIMSAGTIYDGDGNWGNLPDPSNPNDPRHSCILYKAAYANMGASSALSVYGNEDPCNSALPEWNSLSRHTQGSNLTFSDGHSKWLRNSKITIDYAMGTFAN